MRSRIESSHLYTFSHLNNAILGVTDYATIRACVDHCCFERGPSILLQLATRHDLCDNCLNGYGHIGDLSKIDDVYYDIGFLQTASTLTQLLSLVKKGFASPVQASIQAFYSATRGSTE